MKQQIKNYLIVLLFGIIVAAILATQTGFTRDEIRYVATTYTVQQSDSLETISERFIKLNTATDRRLDEFQEGIREANYSIIGDGDVKEGEILTIGYWEVKK